MLDYLAVGHVTHDRVPGGTLAGGSAYYAAVTARALGVRPRLWTSLGPAFEHYDALRGLELHVTDAAATTTFDNIYNEGVRQQWVHGVAATLDPDALPAGLRDAAVVHLCPVIDEVPLELAACFPGALVGLGVQGWVRSLEPGGRVRAQRWWPRAALLEHVDVAVLSDAEADLQADLVDHLRRSVRLVALTHGARGSTLFVEGRSYEVAAASAREVDPTGAGDVYTAALLVRLAQGAPALVAAEAAALAAAAIVEAPGASGAARILDRVRGVSPSPAPQ